MIEDSLNFWKNDLLGLLYSIGKYHHTSHDFDFALTNVIAKLKQLPPQAAPEFAPKLSAALHYWNHFQLAVPGKIRLHVLNEDALEQKPELSWLWLFHPNGHCREAALHALPLAPLTSFYLSALFFRANDWVPQVRAAAEARLATEVHNTSGGVATEVVDFLLQRIGTWGSLSPQALESFASLLRRIEITTNFVERFMSGGAVSRTREMRACLQFDILDPSLTELATKAKSSTVRRQALRVFYQGYAETSVRYEYVLVDKVYGQYKTVRKFNKRALHTEVNLLGLIRIGLADRSVKVRRMSADTLITHRKHFDDIDQLAIDLEKDVNKSVRERGEFILRTDQNNKPRPYGRGS